MDSYWGHSPEDIVTLLYRLMLRREPDAVGLRTHIQALECNRITPEDLAKEFVASEEFSGRSKAADAVVGIEMHGCQFILPATAGVIGELASEEGYEPWVLPYFLDCCKPGMTVLDVGASWGVFALPAAKRVGATGRVFALEVSAWNCQILLRNIKASGLTNIEILPIGVSDRFGAELLRKQSSTNNNAISTGEDAQINTVELFDVIPVAPLDLFRGQLGPVHVAKMDIEGMEYRACMGGLAFLREHRPQLFIEYSPRFQQIGSGVAGADLLGLLIDLDYGVEILHRNKPRERVKGAERSGVIEYVDAAWRQHVEEDHGTHLDLCLHPWEFAR